MKGTFEDLSLGGAWACLVKPCQTRSLRDPLQPVDARSRPPRARGLKPASHPGPARRAQSRPPQVQDAVAQQAQAQRKALARSMPLRELAVCEDETFYPDTCLVAIEPVSNFILLEQYAPDRTAANWT